MSPTEIGRLTLTLTAGDRVSVTVPGHGIARFVVLAVETAPAHRVQLEQDCPWEVTNPQPWITVNRSIVHVVGSVGTLGIQYSRAGRGRKAVMTFSAPRSWTIDRQRTPTLTPEDLARIAAAEE